MADPSLNQRVAPKEGGTERISDDEQSLMIRQTMPAGRKRVNNSPIKKAIKKSFLKKAYPYLIAGGGTGLGIGLGLKEFIL